MSIQLMTSVPSTSELQSYRIIAEVASNNQHWRKLGGGGTTETVIATILSVMLLARELGISPIQAISGGINNIQGKFEISARLMNQLIRKHGHKIAIKSSTDTLCVIWSKRKDTGEEREERYSIEEAIRSGLVKDNGPWKKIPSDMLFARCISRLARRLYPDCIGGCYVEGEMNDKSTEIATPILPTNNEMDLLPEEPIKLEIPEGIISERVDQFIQQSADATNKSVEEVKKRASQNLDGFFGSFRKWEEKEFCIIPEESCE